MFSTKAEQTKKEKEVFSIYGREVTPPRSEVAASAWNGLNEAIEWVIADICRRPLLDKDIEEAIKKDVHDHRADVVRNLCDVRGSHLAEQVLHLALKRVDPFNPFKSL